MVSKWFHRSMASVSSRTAILGRCRPTTKVLADQCPRPERRDRVSQLSGKVNSDRSPTLQRGLRVLPAGEIDALNITSLSPTAQAIPLEKTTPGELGVPGQVLDFLFLFSFFLLARGVPTFLSIVSL